MSTRLANLTPEQIGLIRGMATEFSSVAMVDLITREYLYIKVIDGFNPPVGVVRFFASDLETLLRQTVHADDIDTVRPFYDIETVADRLAQCDYTESYIYMSIMPDHQWASARWKAAMRDEAGRCTMAYLCIKDVNMDKKLYEKGIREINDITTSAGMGVWKIVVAEGKPPRLMASHKMLELMGLSADDKLSEEEVFAHLSSRIAEKSKEDFLAYNRELHTGRHAECTYAWIHPTLGERYVRCGGILVEATETGAIINGYHYDVTDEVKADRQKDEQLAQALAEAKAANEAKTSFLFNMSHDIRTPMNAIIGFRTLLEKHIDEPEKRADYLNKIEVSSNVLLNIINNVLEMARIEKGALTLDEMAWNVERFNDTLFTMFTDQMERKGISFCCTTDIQHHYAYIDATKLRDVFINLLSNAYKYTDTGGKVCMDLKELDCEREGWLTFQITISDTGMGMSREFLPHLFEEFSREHNSTENKIWGTGLGMSIVKRLVSLMGGTIRVESELGVGTTFVLKLSHRIAEPSSLVEYHGVEVDPELMRGKRILLAEDNDLNAEIAAEILSETGLIVERAADGQQCVEMMQQAKTNYYSAILMDIQMPRMDGYEATRIIRGMQSHAKATIPILAMTANAFEEDRRKSFDAGMNAHIAKPINVAELMMTLMSTIV